jgi:PAS domain S-box-containing protein
MQAPKEQAMDFIQFDRRDPYVRLSFFIIIYSLAIAIGMRFVTQPEGLSVVWPASGIALASLLRGSRKEKRIIAALIFSINLIANLITGVSLLPSLGFATANLLEPVLGVWIIHRWFGDKITFERLSDFIGLITTALAANALTAALGALVPFWAYGSLFSNTLITWWILDGASILILTPLFATLDTGGSILAPLDPGRRPETLFWLIALSISTYFIFGVSDMDIYLEPRPYMLFPLFAWAALRGSPRSSAIITLTATLVALVCTALGLGAFPLGGDTVRERMISVQGFFGVTSIVMLMLSSSATEAKSANEKISRSEARFRSLIEHGGDAITLLDASGKIVYEDPTVAKLTGFRIEERTGKGGLDNVFPDDVETIKQSLAQVMSQQNVPLTIEFRSVRKDGSIWWTEGTATNMLRNPNVQAIVINYRDITERKRLDAERQSLYQRLDLATHSARMGIWDWNIVTNELIWDDRMYELYGLQPGQFGKAYEAWRQGVHPADVEYCDRAVQSALRGEQEYDIEFRVIYPDETLRYLKAYGSVTRDLHGKPLRMIGVNFDITERKVSEVALRESEEKFRMLFENMTTGFALHEMIYDDLGKPINYRYLAINPAFEKLTGISANALLGKTVLDLMPHTEDYWIQTYAKVAETGEPISYENYSRELRKHYGTWVFSPRKGQFAVIFSDVTERKQAEEDRMRLLTELERKNKELESLVYVASHDLRSPLVNIQGFSKNLQKYTGQISELMTTASSLDELRAASSLIFTERIPRALQFIEAGSAKMDALIDGLLRVSRAGRVQLRPAEVDMQSLFQTILNAIAYQIESARAHVEILQPITNCYGDKNLLSQIFSNLIDNAIKYRSNDRPLEIRISSERDARFARYAIEDNGIGIAEENRDKIWEIFHRIGENSSIPGEGLGLTIAVRIVERHGGKIWVESKPGVGSKFLVELPAAAQT